MRLPPAHKESLANPEFQRLESDPPVINRKKKILWGPMNNTFPK